MVMIYKDKKKQGAEFLNQLSQPVSKWVTLND
jgi:hypothetical protein